MQILDALDTLLVEGGCIGRSVEIEVSTEDLVTSLSRQDHLDSHSFDLSAEQVHGRACSDSGDIVGFQVVNDILYSV